MKQIDSQDLDDLAVGCAILGSGGGGSSSYPLMMAKREMERYGPITLINLSDLETNSVVLPLAFAGAPTVEMEKLMSGSELTGIINYYETSLERKMECLMAIEVGGANAFVPLIAAMQTDIPVLDGDMMGRAFPEIHMHTYTLFNQDPSSVVIQDALGNFASFTAKDGKTLERIGRHLIVALGSSVAMAMHPMSIEQTKKCLIPNTLSKAITIGKVCRQAREHGKDPIDAVIHFCRGVLLTSGTICDMDQRIDKGFVFGHAKIQGKNDVVELLFQNEYLIARSNQKLLGTTPDILMLMEQETGTPLSSEIIKYGLKVHLIKIPAPKIWTSKKGLELVGPRVFGYDLDYQRIKI